jgi:ATP-dependent RNA helicase HelY
LRRQLRNLRSVEQDSPCRGCPYFTDHRANHLEIRDLTRLLRGGAEELRQAAHRYRTEFRAFRAVLTETGFLADDRPTPLGLLAASLYGENALIVARAIDERWLEDMEPAELAATLVMLVAEDRGRERAPSRRHFPSPRVEHAYRVLRSELARLAALERDHGLETLRPLSHDYVEPTFRWAAGVPLGEIEPPFGTDLGDVVKAVKNLYSMLRQMEQAIRGSSLHPLVAETRERLERDLIRRV